MKYLHSMHILKRLHKASFFHMMNAILQIPISKMMMEKKFLETLLFKDKNVENIYNIWEKWKKNDKVLYLYTTLFFFSPLIALAHVYEIA